MNIKEFLKKCLASFDYELRRISCHFVDPFKDQQKLFQNQSVRCIFDLGANIGNITEQYTKIFPSAVIYSFEPTEQPFKILSKRFENSDNVKPQNFAVSDSEGYTSFFTYDDSRVNSLLSASQTADQSLFPLSLKVQNNEVRTVTIDNFCKEQKIERLDILKMDIQGAELLALKGATNLLEQQRIDIIYTEVFFADGQYLNQTVFHNLVSFLRQYNYELYGIYDLHRLSNGGLSYGDAIFISPIIRQKIPSLHINLS